MRRYAAVRVRNGIRYLSNQYLENGSALGYAPWKSPIPWFKYGRYLRRHFASHPIGQEYREIFTPYQESTIYALSTAPGRAGIAIVRISGSLCLEVGAVLF